ncbi:suppressor of fused domain protein [Streptomyces sp. NPDC048208]|uniref:suppressor of fused domain protein n=1 Tax=Streptomyces sp. NPDC048208 TaxID=3365515 RepID=UPI00371544BE
MDNRAEKYLAHLDRLCGGAKAEFYSQESSSPALPGVTTLVHEGLSDGMLNAFTYGVSLAEHPAWQERTPELHLSVRSKNVVWAEALSFIADGMRGTCAFAYGDTVDLGERVTPESEMTAFCVFAPALPDPAGYTGLDVSVAGHEGHDLIDIVGLYPLHDIEMRYLHEHGLEALWNRDWDPHDVRRRPAV